MEIKTAVTALAALAQETRLSIYRLLVEAGPQGMAAGRIGEKLNVPGATLSFHLKELSRASLVSARQEKQFIYYAVDFGRMAELMTFLTQNCCRGCRRSVSRLSKQRWGAVVLRKRNPNGRGGRHEPPDCLLHHPTTNIQSAKPPPAACEGDYYGKRTV